MKKLEVRLTYAPDDVRPIGTLADQSGTIFFEWNAAYLRGGLELSPFKLPLVEGLHEHKDLSFGALPGLFEQSLPDGWGLLLMDRHFRRQGLNPSSLSVLDRLACLGTSTMGALTYHPCAADLPPANVDLYELGENAQQIFDGDTKEALPQLMRAGGSPGGAHPKVLVGVRGEEIVSGERELPEGFEPWLVKFASKTDAESAGPVEQAYALMAGAAGVPMPQTRLFEVGEGAQLRRYFGVRRFDREGQRRVHVQSLANLVHANFRIPSLDYETFLRVTTRLTGNQTDLKAAYRQMLFNIAAHVRDDHSKNFAFLLDEQGDWRLTPAYDLTYADGPGGEHSMSVNGEGRAPTRADCAALAGRLGISDSVVAGLIDQVNAAVARWEEFADAACCPRTEREAIGAKLGGL